MNQKHNNNKTRKCVIFSEKMTIKTMNRVHIYIDTWTIFIHNLNTYLANNLT